MVNPNKTGTKDNPLPFFEVDRAGSTKGSPRQKSYRVEQTLSTSKKGHGFSFSPVLHGFTIKYTGKHHDNRICLLRGRPLLPAPANQICPYGHVIHQAKDRVFQGLVSPDHFLLSTI